MAKKLANIPTFECEECRNAVPRKQVLRVRRKNASKSNPGRIDREFQYNVRFCSKRCANLARYKNPTGHVDKHGYVVISLGRRRGAPQVYEQRLVMEKKLGRKLAKHETVHHKNTIRTDNHPDDLELWSSRHGSGGRVSDQIAWAKKLLTEYNEPHIPFGSFDVGPVVNDEAVLGLPIAA